MKIYKLLQHQQFKPFWHYEGEVTGCRLFGVSTLLFLFLFIFKLFIDFFSSTFYLLQYFYSPCSEVGWCLVIISCPGHVFIPNLRDDLADLQTEICLPCVTWIIKHDNICHDYKKRLLLSGRHACISLFRL